MASSTFMPWTALAYMSTMMYLAYASVALADAGPGRPILGFKRSTIGQYFGKSSQHGDIDQSAGDAVDPNSSTVSKRLVTDQRRFRDRGNAN
jgi:hypothetical protein